MSHRFRDGDAERDDHRDGGHQVAGRVEGEEGTAERRMDDAGGEGEDDDRGPERDVGLREDPWVHE